MVVVWLGLFAMFGLFGVALLKILNVARGFSFYPKEGLYIGTAIAIFFWVVFFISVLSAISVMDTVTLEDGSELIIKSNDYIILVNFFQLVNYTLFGIFGLTVVEFIATLPSYISAHFGGMRNKEQGP